MAFLSFPHVRIAGIAAGVPKNVVSNEGAAVQSKDYDAAAFVATTGVKERRIGDFTTSDLSYAAAEQLIADLGWNKEDIGAIIFVSQYADYILPATACVLQERLGLNKETYSMDISLGCSGWVYGLSTVVSLLNCGSIRKALLLAGDAKKRYEVLDYKTLDPLFGHAGTATAIEFAEDAKGLDFHFGTDGSGYDAIIVPEGGARNPFNAKSLEKEEVDGRMLHRLEARMNGMDVFSFAISTAPMSVKALAAHCGFDHKEADYFVFHQANMKINNLIAKLLKIDKAKVPSCMYNFGNTSSASIPLTIVSELRGKVQPETKFICCGFGVGLSWGTVAFQAENMIVSKLVEVE